MFMLQIFALCLIIFLPFLYETSHVFRYYFRFFIYGFTVMFNSVILIPYMLFRPCDAINLITASHFCSPVSRILGLKWDIRGRENLEQKQACIIVANHQSSLDILGMFHLWPIMGKCTVIARREVFYFWPFGLAAYFAGLIFIDRANTARAKEKMDSCVVELKKKQTKLWVFPEGTRRNTGEIHDFKKGAFHVAIKGQIPILPVVFSSYRNFLDAKNKKFTSGHVIVNALPFIPTIGLKGDDILKLIEQTRNAMSDSYKTITREVELNQNLQLKNKIENTSGLTECFEKKLQDNVIKHQNKTTSAV